MWSQVLWCVCTLNTPTATPAPQAATEGFPVWNQPGLDNEPVSQKQANALIVLWSHYQCGGIWRLDRRGQLGVENMYIVRSSFISNMVCSGVCVCVCHFFSWIRRRHCFLPNVNSGFMKSSLECHLPFRVLQDCESVIWSCTVNSLNQLMLDLQVGTPTSPLTVGSHLGGLEESTPLVSWSQPSAWTGIFLSQASSWDPPITLSSSHWTSSLHPMSPPPPSHSGTNPFSRWTVS